jgi:hypothetical protein
MTDDADIVVRHVVDDAGRADVVAVLAATYREEKRWVSDAEGQFPPGDIGREDIAWFVAGAPGSPLGVVRVLYDPPVALYARYGFQPIDPGIRIEDFIDVPGLAEVGRFAVLPGSRGRFMVAAALMRAVTIDSLRRGVTHVITDVFEDDPNSPFGFHTRVLGFRPVATHDVGELNSASRRITLILDVAAARQRLEGRNSWFHRYLRSAMPAAAGRRRAA